MLPLIAAAILTGGQARRFSGQDKSRLVVSGEAGTILDAQLATLSPITAEILIVTSAMRFAAFASVPGVRAVPDAYPGTGPLGAVVTALGAAGSNAVFVLGGDMPHVPGPLVLALAARHAAEGNDVTVPESSRGPEPLAAVYGRGALPVFIEVLGTGNYSLQRALGAGLRVGRMAPLDVAAFGDPERIFRNINAPEDL